MSQLGALLIGMEATAWDTPRVHYAAGCCKDRPAIRPDRCNGRGVGPFLRGLAGFGAIGAGPAAQGLGVGDWIAGPLGSRCQRGCCSSERLVLGGVALGPWAWSLQDGQEAADPQGQEREGAK